MKEQLEVLGAEGAMSLGMSSLTLGSEPRLAPGGRFTVMMFGMTGSGKSALGNLLAGYDHFRAGDDTASITNSRSVLKYESPDKSLVLLDTIGLGDTELDQDKVVANIRDCALSAPNGVDAMFFVMRSGRITDDVIARLIYATEYLWGTECLLNLYIIVTYASRYVSQREEALTWIERQNELNWRFRHIFSLVGKNVNRILFVDNPDPADGEPLTRLRRHNSRLNIMKALVHHPREVIPPFTHSMMKKAQERMEDTYGKVKQAEDDLAQLEAKAKEATDQAAHEKEMEEARARRKQAEEAWHQEMKNIQEDEEFRRMAAQAVEEATVAFGKKYDADKASESVSTAATVEDRTSSLVKADDKGSSPLEACRRVFRALRRRFVKPTAKAAGSPEPTKASGNLLHPVHRLTPEQLEARIEEAHLELVTHVEAPKALFAGLDSQGMGALTPVQFQLFVRKACPGMSQAQVGGIWRRADENCDGKVTEQEFLKLLSFAPESKVPGR